MKSCPRCAGNLRKDYDENIYICMMCSRRFTANFVPFGAQDMVEPAFQGNPRTSNVSGELIGKNHSVDGRITRYR